MNALIYADEYQLLEQQLDMIQQRLATHGRCPNRRSLREALAAERDVVTFRLMQLDGLIAYDADLVA